MFLESAFEWGNFNEEELIPKWENIIEAFVPAYSTEILSGKKTRKITVVETIWSDFLNKTSNSN